MAKNDLTALSIEELQAKVEELNQAIAIKSKGDTIAQIVKLLEEADLATVNGILASLTAPASKKRERKSKKNRAERLALSLVDGKVFFGEQEITNTKNDKNGVLRIVKTGKGLPAEVAKQSEEIKAVLLALPIVE